MSTTACAKEGASMTEASREDKGAEESPAKETETSGSRGVDRWTGCWTAQKTAGCRTNCPAVSPGSTGARSHPQDGSLDRIRRPPFLETQLLPRPQVSDNRSASVSRLTAHGRRLKQYVTKRPSAGSNVVSGGPSTSTAPGQPLRRPGASPSHGQ